jgi:Ca2+/Na+ antiporter
MYAVLAKGFYFIEIAAECMVRREVIFGLILVFVVSFPFGSEVVGWINTSALVALCLLIILWGLNKVREEMQEKF